MTDRIRLIKHEAAPRCGSFVRRRQAKGVLLF
jgi:hypothetical protein